MFKIIVIILAIADNSTIGALQSKATFETEAACKAEIDKSLLDLKVVLDEQIPGGVKLNGTCAAAEKDS